jgi:hypothetical protein
MGSYVPPGWPASVPPPDTGRWEEAAIAWLLDVIPPGYGDEEILRQHPAALIWIARNITGACYEEARTAYRITRTELSDMIPPHAIDAMLKVYRSEDNRLKSTARGVDLIDRAMPGQRFGPRR